MIFVKQVFPGLHITRQANSSLCVCACVCVRNCILTDFSSNVLKKLFLIGFNYSNVSVYCISLGLDNGVKLKC